MAIPLQVTFRDMPPSDALENYIQSWVEKIETIHPRIERCAVVIERPHQHHRHGQRIRVRVSLAVPGPDVVVSRDHALDAAHEDAYVAVRDAFSAARRQLEDHVRKRRRDVKARVEPEHGRVAYLDAEGEWGYLDASGRQVYFHRNSVVGGEPLAVGDEVRFHEGRGDKGPQASSVTAVGEHGRHAVRTL